jgi:hypothetical protein
MKNLRNLIKLHDLGITAFEVIDHAPFGMRRGCDQKKEKETFHAGHSTARNQPIIQALSQDGIE